jgi:small-conductance mechanosensitive channel
MSSDELAEDTTSVLSDISNAVSNIEESFFTQLHELMTTQLFNLQNTPVTIYSLVMFFVFLTVFAIGGKILSRLIFFRLLGNIQMDDGIRYTLMRFTNYFVIFIGVVISFQFIGIDLSGLAVIFGLLSVGIGFGLQNVTSNFIAGLILGFGRNLVDQRCKTAHSCSI